MFYTKYLSGTTLSPPLPNKQAYKKEEIDGKTREIIDNRNRCTEYLDSRIIKQKFF